MNELLLYTTYLVCIKGVLPTGQDAMTPEDFIRKTSNGRKMLQLRLIAKPEYEIDEKNVRVLTSGGDTGVQNENVFNDPANETLFNKIATEVLQGRYTISPADKTTCELTSFYFVGQFREMFTADEYRAYNVVSDGKGNQKVVDFKVKRNSVDATGNVIKIEEVVKTRKIKFFMHKFELEKPNAEDIAMNKFRIATKAISAYKRWEAAGNAGAPTADADKHTTQGADEVVVDTEKV